MLEAHAILWARLVVSQAREVFDVDFTFREWIFAIGRGMAKTGGKALIQGLETLVFQVRAADAVGGVEDRI